LGIPFLYIGPVPSHVTELSPAAAFRHGDVDGVARFLSTGAAAPLSAASYSNDDFSQQTLLTRMVAALQAVVGQDSFVPPVRRVSAGAPKHSS
jgi:hypothetical protein